MKKLIFRKILTLNTNISKTIKDGAKITSGSPGSTPVTAEGILIKYLG